MFGFVKELFDPNMDFLSPQQWALKIPRKTKKSFFFRQNGGENYFRFRFSTIFLFSTHDLIILGKNLKNFPGALF